jgi:hypothetical protein
VTATPHEPRRPPYWLVPVFVALLLSPPAWAVAALIGAAITVTIGRAAIRARARLRAAAGAVSAADGVALGVDRTGAAVWLTDHQLSAHGLILGASGSGKTTTLLAILTDHIRRGKPVIAIDLKGSPEFAAALGDAAAAAGRPFRVWTPDGPSHWNPLEHGNATELKDKLIATERFTEPHYQRAAERYAQMVLRVLEHVHPERPPTLHEVVGLMEPMRIPGLLRALPRLLAVQIQDYLAGLTPDQHSAIRGLGTRLAVISESHTGRYLSPGEGSDTIDLHRAAAQREVVVFSLNSGSYGGLSTQIGTLIVQDLIAASGSRMREQAVPGGGRPEQAVIAIDEFSALGADQIASLFARARSAGYPVLLATQELSDLERAGRGLRDQIVGNSAVVIAHRQDVPDSADLIARMVGTEERWEYVHHVQTGWRRGIGTGRATKRLSERFTIHPNEIKTLRTGEAVLITKLPEARALTIRVTQPSWAGEAGHQSGGGVERDPSPVRRQGQVHGLMAAGDEPSADDRSRRGRATERLHGAGAGERQRPADIGNRSPNRAQRPVERGFER